jgi:hypothetical protein
MINAKARKGRNGVPVLQLPNAGCGLKGPRNRTVRDPHGPLDESWYDNNDIRQREGAHVVDTGCTLAGNLFDLPPPDRLKRFRELAAEAEAFAATMKTQDLRDGYLTIAYRWTELASQLEKSMHHPEQAEAPEEHSATQPGEE